MIVLGIDPGTIITGYGIVEKSENKFKLIASGIIPNRNLKSIPQRLKIIYENIISIINQYSPDEFAIESAFYGKNIQSTLKIGHARGVSILAAVNNDIPISEYSPREVKKAVTGNGAASKQQVLYMINQIFNLKKSLKNFDETDAIAIAICHLQKISNPVKKFNNWKTFIEQNPDKIIK